MLQILDENFQILQTVPHIKSIQWTTRFTEAGSFRLQLPQDFWSDTDDLMGKFIRHKGHYGIIQYITADEEQLEIRGYDLKAITIFRQVLPLTYTGAVETVVKQIVEDNTQGERGFPNFTITADQKRGDTITYTIEKADTLENVLKKLCEDHGIGYEISVQNQGMCFDIVIPETVDHTYSERRRNVTGWEYTHDQLTEKNTEVIYCPAVSTSLTALGNKTGKILASGKICVLDKIYDLGENKELCNINYEHSVGYVHYIFASQSSSGDLKFFVYENRNYGASCLGRIDYFLKDVPTFTMFPTFLSMDCTAAVTTATGFLRKETGMEATEAEIPSDKIKEDLSGKVESETISAEILSPDDYRTVWNLGDFIKIKINLFGQSLTVSRQITEIDEVYEPNNLKLTPVFGKQKDNIIRKLQKGRM